jgi:hypothetical protein
MTARTNAILPDAFAGFGCKFIALGFTADCIQKWVFLSAGKSQTAASGAKRTFAEKLCELSANRQHHSISLLDGAKRSDLARTV